MGCQRDGWGGWIANPMDCPSTTGFDQNLLICNYMSKLPRCQDNTNPQLYGGQDLQDEGVYSRLTRHNQIQFGLPQFMQSPILMNHSSSTNAAYSHELALPGVQLLSPQESQLSRGNGLTVSAYTLEMNEILPNQAQSVHFSGLQLLLLTILSHISTF